MRHLVTLVCVCLLIGASLTEEWNYDRHDSINGPNDWKSGKCSTGSAQSPIDFGTRSVYKMRTLPWKLLGWNSYTQYTVKNNGHTIKFTPESTSIKTAGGGFPATYNFAQFHFHWGARNKKGSEHTINGDSYPLEMHLVHYKSKYANLGAAVAASEDVNSLAAVGFFFEVTLFDNPALTYLLDGVESAQGDHATVENVTMNTLLQLTGDVTNGDFYRYNGSLTTPTCNEQVLWTVFSTPIPISAAQLDTFRQVTTDDTELYRPIQPVNGRTVLKYVSCKGSSCGGGYSFRPYDRFGFRHIFYPWWI